MIFFATETENHDRVMTLTGGVVTQSRDTEYIQSVLERLILSTHSQTDEYIIC